MVVGYIEEEEEEDEKTEKEEGEEKGAEAEVAPAVNPRNKFRIAGKAVIGARKASVAGAVSGFDLVRG